MSKTIPTDIEIFGYKKVLLNQKATDFYLDPDPNIKYVIYRVPLDISNPLVIDLGQGRQIRIKFDANKNNLT